MGGRIDRVGEVDEEDAGAGGSDTGAKLSLGSVAGIVVGGGLW
jgi:hypothetical protein